MVRSGERACVGNEEVSHTAGGHYNTYVVLFELLAAILDFDVHNRVDRASCGYSDGLYDFAVIVVMPMQVILDVTSGFV